MTIVLHGPSGKSLYVNAGAIAYYMAAGDSYLLDCGLFSEIVFSGGGSVSVVETTEVITSMISEATP